MNDQNLDPPELPPAARNLKNMEVTCMKIVCTLFSIATYIADITFDIIVADRLYKEKEYVFFGFTILFIVLPTIIMTIFSVFWYLHDESSEPSNTTTFQWFIRIIFIAFMMVPVLRNLEALYYAIKSATSDKAQREKQNYVRRMVYENIDSAMLRLFEAFMQCAPQVILQLLIVGSGQYGRPNQFNETEKIQLLSVITSILSMSVAVASYQTNLRESLDYKNDFNCSVGVFPFMWRICELTARMVILGVFSSILLPYTALLFIVHFMVMFFMTRAISTDFCGNRAGELLYNLMLSYMYFFCFINPKDDRTLISYIFYYVVISVENVAMISVWYENYLSLSIYRLPVLITVMVSHASAIFIMVFYYALLHPTRGKIYGRPCPIKPEDNIEDIEAIAREFGLDEDIINRFRRERETIPARNAADFFQNVPPNERRTGIEEQQL